MKKDKDLESSFTSRARLPSLKGKSGRSRKKFTKGSGTRRAKSNVRRRKADKV